MDRSKLICLVVLLVAVPLLTLQQASAQAVYGSILGTVTDAQGAVVPNTKITVTSVGKGTTVTGTTNESGNYSILHLIPDSYNVRFEGAGFKALEQKNVGVLADSGSRLDAQLLVGGTSETVEVTAEAPQLKTDRSDVSVEFSSKQLAELPVYNRSFQALELLTPGTQVITGWAHAATENPQGSKQIFVNGQHFSGTGYELDGTDNQDPILGIIIVNPSLDSVTETKMTTQNYDAEFGKAVAGIMTAQTKSGSNQFHGSGYFYDLDPKGPAKNPFSGTAAAVNWKQYGGAIGGPIFKNKLFFFANYETTRRKSGTNLLVTVPTAKVRATCLTAGSANCDLSEYLTAGLGGGAGQVYNPYEAQGSRSPYAGNIIPMSDLQTYDPTGVAEKVLNLLPAPNAPGVNNGTVNNYSASGSGSFNDYQYTGRVDYYVSQKMQVFGRYTHSNYKLSGNPVFGPAIGGPGLGPLGLAGQSLINNYSVASGFNYTLSNTLLMDFRFGYFRYNPHSTKYPTAADAAAQLGFAGLNTSDPTTAGLPHLLFDQTIGNSTNGGGSSGLGQGLDVSRCNCPLIEKEQGEQYAVNLTKMLGNHQLKFGTDLRHATNLRVPSDSNRSGVLRFNHSGTSDNNTGGLDIATFLFGEVTSLNRYVGSSLEANAVETQNRYFFYGQDTWRATHKLTVNYGLRWEFYTPEKVNAKGAGGFAVLPQGVIRVAGYGSNSLNGSTRANYKLIAPRLGITYEIDPKTVVRLGYGRSFDIGVFGSLFGHTVTQNLPVLANQRLHSPTNDDKTPAFNFTGQCLPAPNDTSICGPTPNAFPVVPTDGILPLFGPFGDVSPHIRPDHLKAPTVDAWNVTVQRQLTKNASLEIAYVANHGSSTFKGNGPSYNLNQASVVNFDTPNPANPIDPTTGLPGVWSYNQRAPYSDAFVTNYDDGAGNITAVHCCGGNGFDFRGNDGTNSYKALQIKFNQRTGAGLTMLAHYTYSRAYDNDGGYNLDQNAQYGRQDFTRGSEFVLTSLYELPIGRGKRFGGHMGRAADLALGGWQWNTTLTIASGLPFSPGYNNCNLDRDTGPCRPSISGAFHLGAGKFDPVTHAVQYFTPVAQQLCDNPDQNIITLEYVCHDPADKKVQLLVLKSGAFDAPGVGKFGNIRRNQFTGPGEIMSDMSIFKNFSFTETVKAQFQAQFFNVFNHPVYNLPGNSCVDCGGAGVINSLQGDLRMREFQLGLRFNF